MVADVMMMNAAVLPVSPLRGPSTLNSHPNEMNTNTVPPFVREELAKSKKTLQEFTLEMSSPFWVSLCFKTKLSTTKTVIISLISLRLV